MAVEVELKLKLSPAAKADFLQLPILQAASASSCTQHLVNIYFDTPDLALTRQRMALRLRQKGDQWLQTLKHGGTSGAGLHQRPEIEMPVPGDSLDLGLFNGSEIGQFLQRDDIGPSLQPVFSTNFDRTTWEIAGENGSLVELALDEGTIASNGRQMPLLEVELELKKGEVADLFRLAFQLADRVPLVPDAQSKAQRGYALYRDVQPAPVHASDRQLAHTLSAYQALQVVLGDILGQLQANVQGVLTSDDPEFIHQARIAFRRLRTLEKTFGRLLPETEWQAITPAIKALAGQLGQARDWHVLLTETLPALTPVIADTSCEERLVKEIRGHQAAAVQAARQALQSADYGRLLLHLLALAYHPRAITDAARQSLDDFAAKALHKREKSWQHLAKEWDSLDANGRHELRKKTKKLRYATEFFSTLYKPHAVEKYLHSLQHLQGTLGEINDAVTGQQRLQQLAADAPALGFCAGFAAGCLASRLQHLESSLDHQVKQLIAAKTFW